ncbi:NAD(P)-binding protein [Amphritea atlantica]|uniref:NAD(P)-binding protein n=1 Tax=Amphritea atlantica TaxID=355243 RepID=A0ABY5GT60_9GAMM|nr:NAD(P)-binding protein [Amphritea atlantica]
MTKKIAIVGAGFAGAVLADRLSAFAEITVFEKSRGSGGRISSCRLADYSADLGAPWFRPSTDAFRMWLEQQPEISRWQPQVSDFNHQQVVSERLYVTEPKQSALTRRLSSKAKLITQCRVESVIPWQTEQTTRIVLRDDRSRGLGFFDTVIITAPAVQARVLLEAIPGLASNAESVSSDPCWVCVVRIKAQLGSTDIFYGDHPILLRCCKDSAKPGRLIEDNSEVWVLEATQQWSADHTDVDSTAVSDVLYAAFCELMQQTPEIVSSRTHRWLLARHSSVNPIPFLWSSETGIGACGDWLNDTGLKQENALEASWLSANALADTILQESR